METFSAMTERVFGAAASDTAQANDSQPGGFADDELERQFTQLLDSEGVPAVAAPTAELPGPAEVFATVGRVEAGAPPADVSASEAARLNEAVLFADLDKAPPGGPLDTPATLAERILDGLNSMRDGHEGVMSRINDLVDAEDLTAVKMADMMRVFVEFHHLKMQEEMVGKVVGKAVQDLDTLLKAQ